MVVKNEMEVIIIIYAGEWEEKVVIAIQIILGVPAWKSYIKVFFPFS